MTCSRSLFIVIKKKNRQTAMRSQVKKSQASVTTVWVWWVMWWRNKSSHSRWKPQEQVSHSDGSQTVKRSLNSRRWTCIGSGRTCSFSTVTVSVQCLHDIFPACRVYQQSSSQLSGFLYRKTTGKCAFRSSYTSCTSFTSSLHSIWIANAKDQAI